MNNKIKEIIGEILDLEVSEINDDASILDDLGADSIAVMEIVMELESEFDLEIETEEIPNFKTVNDIVAFIESK
ncbi:acyl carrier protein [Bacilli bacterium PM5-3]|nr:acyl carrier protein [Bacilli bacterium PM5-3]MDH6602907.1 acyl carrier protein [Bacilli bacterium PM5-9]